MLISDTLESNCPKCYEPVTIYNPTHGAAGYCKECLSCDWLVVSQPVIQDGVVIRGILRHEVKWRRSSKADVDARMERAGLLPVATAPTSEPLTDASEPLAAEPTAKPPDKITEAIALLRKHPNWTDKAIAEEVGCSPANLSKSLFYRAARQGIKGLGQEGPAAVTQAP
jgi:hypothetical protein